MPATDPEPLDPRIARTRRDVIDATCAILLEGGWDDVTHAEVARRSGYSKATVYTHWPTRLDLIRDSIGQICDQSDHPAATGDLRADLRAALVNFANDLTVGHLDRLIGGVVERAHQSPVVAGLRARLYDTGTGPMRDILAAHLPQKDVAPSLALLTGAVFTHVTFEGKPATRAAIDGFIERVLSSTPAA